MPCRGRRRATALVIVLAVLVGASACAARVFAPPPGPGTPAPDAMDAWQQASSACRDVKSFSGTLRVAFRQGRLRSPSLTVSTIVTSSGDIRLEDATQFTLAGRAGSARLLLRQERRYAEGRTEEIVNAFAGVKLGPERLLAVLSGCLTSAPQSARPADARRFGDEIAVPFSDGQVFLEREHSRWRAFAGVGSELTVEYRAFDAYWPREWRATSFAGSSTDPILLDAHVEDRDVSGAPVDPAAFQVILGGATRITLDELRQFGPLRGRS
jgi:hypothetical protein